VKIDQASVLASAVDPLSINNSNGFGNANITFDLKKRPPTTEAGNFTHNRVQHIFERP